VSEAELLQPGSNRLGFLFKDTFLYGAANACARATSLVSFPILSRVLVRADYALADMFAVLISMLLVVVAFGQAAAVARFFYDSQELDHRRAVVSESLLLQLGVSLAAVALGALLAPLWAELLFGKRELGFLLAVALAQLPFTLSFRFAVNLLKWTFRARAYVVLTLGFAVCNVLGVVVLVFWLRLGLAGVVYGTVISSVLFGSLGLWLCRAWIGWPRSWRLAGPMLRYGWPHWVAGLLVAVLPVVDRWTLGVLLDLGAVAVFAVGAKVAGLLQIPIWAFDSAWAPFALVLHQDPEADALYAGALRVYGWGLGAITLGLCVFSEALIRVLAGSGYVAAAPLVTPLVLGLAVQSIGWISSLGIELTKRTTFVLWSHLLALVTTGVGLAVLVPRVGIMGAALAAAAGMGVECAARTVFAYRVHPLRFALRTPLYCLLVTYLVAAAAEWATVGLVGRGALVLGYLGLGWYACGVGKVVAEIRARRARSAT